MPQYTVWTDRDNGAPCNSEWTYTPPEAQEQAAKLAARGHQNVTIRDCFTRAKVPFDDSQH